jgi:hypothetical protein
MIEYRNPRDLATAAKIRDLSIHSVMRLIHDGQLTAYRVAPKRGYRVPHRVEPVVGGVA